MTAATYSWKNYPALMARLKRVQGEFPHIDLMTFAGWAGSEQALRSHVEHYEAELAQRKGVA